MYKFFLQYLQVSRIYNSFLEDTRYNKLGDLCVSENQIFAIYMDIINWPFECDFR